MLYYLPEGNEERNKDTPADFASLQKTYLQNIEEVRRLIKSTCAIPGIAAVISPAFFLTLFDNVTTADLREALLAILACSMFAFTSKIADKKCQQLVAHAPYLALNGSDSADTKKTPIIDSLTISSRIAPMCVVGQLTLGAAWILAHQHIYDEGNIREANYAGIPYFIQLLVIAISIRRAHDVVVEKVAPFSKHLVEGPMQVWDVQRKMRVA